MEPRAASIWVTLGMVSLNNDNLMILINIFIRFPPPHPAYLSRHYNVLAVDWYQLTQYPCYITALANTKLVAQCTAQVILDRIHKPQSQSQLSSILLFQMYAYLSHKGSHPKRITCVGHSLGAHICGMMANHLSTKQHKIIGS